MPAATASAQNIGRVTQIIGSTFDVQFAEHQLPAIYNAVKITSQQKGIKRGAATSRRRPGSLIKPKEGSQEGSGVLWYTKTPLPRKTSDQGVPKKDSERCRSPSSEWPGFAKQLRRLIRDGIRLSRGEDLRLPEYAGRRDRVHSRLDALTTRRCHSTTMRPNA